MNVWVPKFCHLFFTSIESKIAKSESCVAGESKLIKISKLDF